MKFSSLLLPLLGLGAIAAPVKRQIIGQTNMILVIHMDMIRSMTGTLDAVIGSLTADNIQTNFTLFDHIVGDISSAFLSGTQISQTLYSLTGQYTNPDTALPIYTTFASLDKATMRVLKDVIGRKSVFRAAGKDGQVGQLLDEWQGALDGFSNNLSILLPDESSADKNLTTALDAAFVAAQKSFEEN